MGVECRLYPAVGILRLAQPGMVLDQTSLSGLVHVAAEGKLSVADLIESVYVFEHAARELSAAATAGVLACGIFLPEATTIPAVHQLGMLLGVECELLATCPRVLHANRNESTTCNINRRESSTIWADEERPAVGSDRVGDMLIVLLTLVLCDEHTLRGHPQGAGRHTINEGLGLLGDLRELGGGCLGLNPDRIGNALLALALVNDSDSGGDSLPFLLPESLPRLVVLLFDIIDGKTTKGDSRVLVVEVGDCNLFVLLRIEDGPDPPGFRIEGRSERIDGAVGTGNAADAPTGHIVAAGNNALGLPMLPLGCIGWAFRPLRRWSIYFASLPSPHCLLRVAIALLVLLPLGLHLVVLVSWYVLGNHRPRQDRVPVEGILELLSQAVDTVDVLRVLAVHLALVDAGLAQRAFGAGQEGGVLVGSVLAPGFVARIVVDAVGSAAHGQGRKQILLLLWWWWWCDVASPVAL
mmetsp:Transcript_11374/g.26766  ORF Transcript_11374/g.26766 Transcript_11374/m.26766 type:complete len:467 (-) Transcript_11374:1524-2924(-)